LLLLCCLDAKERLDGWLDELQEKQQHLVKWHTWLASHLQQAEAGEDFQRLLGLNQAERAGLIQERATQLAQTDLAAAGSALVQVTRAVERFCQGETDALAALGQDAELLSKVHPPADTFDVAPFLRLLSHQRPHLRILEIGAAGPTMAGHIINSLRADPHGGSASYYSYTYASSSEAAVARAKESLKGLARVDFRVLDVSQNPVAQEFQRGAYDLVIAANVLYTTPNIRTSLENVRSLLAPNGRLLMQELGPRSKWINFTLVSISSSLGPPVAFVCSEPSADHTLAGNLTNLVGRRARQPHRRAVRLATTVGRRADRGRLCHCRRRPRRRQRRPAA
jgi:2-polyprenyl-3-methyl-5-hydroxy-6-metoxy-1,4-benzoquinol methylase